mmetsp:Transcript_331/g.1310  ORF Transcript_331/g.1310 Transcript_331/m.1310 type:complete len:117 (+) Transcript_331:1315-1665(+)
MPAAPVEDAQEARTGVASHVGRFANAAGDARVREITETDTRGVQGGRGSCCCGGGDDDDSDGAGRSAQSGAKGNRSNARDAAHTPTSAPWRFAEGRKQETICRLEARVLQVSMATS